MTMSHLSIYIIAWLISVLMMTSFSVLISYISKKEYREPTLLSKLISGNNKDVKETSGNLFLGYLIHFAIGGVFIIIYILLYRYIEQISSIFWTLLVGLLFGGMGIFGWILLLEITKNPPKIHYKGFFLQLIFAHIIFCLSAMLILNWGFNQNL